MVIEFAKYEGAGNDFIIINGSPLTGNSLYKAYPDLDISARTARLLCDRNYGIGADGILILRASPDHDFSMEYLNSDGGEASMCGNGARCIALYAYHVGVVGEQMTFEGRDGVHRARIIEQTGGNAVLEVSMKDVGSYEYRDRAFVLDTGVPHYVEFVDELDSLDVITEGHRIRWDERFTATGGTNVDFVKILADGKISVRTYERGVENETKACGTGAVAAAIATHIYAQGNINDFMVNVPGGRLDVSFDVAEGSKIENITLTGSARMVFSGVIDTSNFRMAY